MGSEKNTWGYKTSGQLLLYNYSLIIRFHGNQCTGNVICSNTQNTFVFVFDGNRHEMRLQLDSSNHVTLFESLPEHWIPAIALLREGDSVSVELLPSFSSPTQEGRWCDWSPRGEVCIMGEVSDTVLKVTELILQDLVNHLTEGEIRQNRLYSY